ncbi:HEAT repeat domain-containing protein [Dehalogenimonas etheniformans]|uniref:HEAT repeat domain-containing protein n=1 Tax=Dehalogenimonas etheniformans TaxID=1536648 RepID=A0A2P5P8P6_9CHLR|nr:HEAT repeat domain-containing protein [Dehalogenimonas etheniformans]PPD58667.1 HEAT repeat domain-containing protein [Dehalogenimonas etheniformans]QNT76562.1 HEAT repeat domain-containing protein [Dehalogenimonas etheniformans]
MDESGSKEEKQSPSLADASPALSDVWVLEEQKDVLGLIELLETTKSKSEAKAAIYALQKLSDPKSTSALFNEALFGEHGIAAREAAIRAFALIEKESAVDFLIYLTSKGPHPGHAAVEALGEIDHPLSVECLVNIATNPHVDMLMQEKAIGALLKAGQAAVGLLISAVTSDQKCELRSKAAHVLVEMMPDVLVCKDQVAKLIATFESDIDPEVISSVGAILGKVGDIQATIPLVEVFKKFVSTNPDLAEKILEALCELKDPSAVPFLLKTLDQHPSLADKDNALQCYVILALGRFADKQATGPLLQLLLDKTQELRIRISAAMALGDIVDNEAIEPMISVLEDDRVEGSVRNSVFDALFRYPGNIAAVQLLTYLKKNPGITLRKSPDAT